VTLACTLGQASEETSLDTALLAVTAIHCVETDDIA